MCVLEMLSTTGDVLYTPYVYTVLYVLYTPYVYTVLYVLYTPYVYTVQYVLYTPYVYTVLYVLYTPYVYTVLYVQCIILFAVYHIISNLKIKVKLEKILKK